MQTGREKGGGRWEAFSKGLPQLMDPMDLAYILDRRPFIVQPSYLSDLGTGTRRRLALRLGLFPPVVTRNSQWIDAAQVS